MLTSSFRFPYSSKLLLFALALAMAQPGFPQGIQDGLTIGNGRFALNRPQQVLPTASGQALLLGNEKLSLMSLKTGIIEQEWLANSMPGVRSARNRILCVALVNQSVWAYVQSRQDEKSEEMLLELDVRTLKPKSYKRHDLIQRPTRLCVSSDGRNIYLLQARNVLAYSVETGEVNSIFAGRPMNLEVDAQGNPIVIHLDSETRSLRILKIDQRGLGQESHLDLFEGLARYTRANTMLTTAHNRLAINYRVSLENEREERLAIVDIENMRLDFDEPLEPSQYGRSLLPTSDVERLWCLSRFQDRPAEFEAFDWSDGHRESYQVDHLSRGGELTDQAVVLQADNTYLSVIDADNGRLLNPRSNPAQGTIHRGYWFDDTRVLLSGDRVQVLDLATNQLTASWPQSGFMLEPGQQATDLFAYHSSPQVHLLSAMDAEYQLTLKPPYDVGSSSQPHLIMEQEQQVKIVGRDGVLRTWDIVKGEQLENLMVFAAAPQDPFGAGGLNIQPRQADLALELFPGKLNHQGETLGFDRPIAGGQAMGSWGLFSADGQRLTSLQANSLVMIDLRPPFTKQVIQLSDQPLQSYFWRINQQQNRAFMIRPGPSDPQTGRVEAETLCVYDLSKIHAETTELEPMWTADFRGNSGKLQISDDGRLVASSATLYDVTQPQTFERATYFGEVETGAELQVMNDSGHLLDFSPDSQWVLFSYLDNRLVVRSVSELLSLP